MNGHHTFLHNNSPLPLQLSKLQPLVYSYITSSCHSPSLPLAMSVCFSSSKNTWRNHWKHICLRFKPRTTVYSSQQNQRSLGIRVKIGLTNPAREPPSSPLASMPVLGNFSNSMTTLESTNGQYGWMYRFSLSHRKRSKSTKRWKNQEPQTLAPWRKA